MTFCSVRELLYAKPLGIRFVRWFEIYVDTLKHIVPSYSGTFDPGRGTYFSFDSLKVNHWITRNIHLCFWLEKEKENLFFKMLNLTFYLIVRCETVIIEKEFTLSTHKEVTNYLQRHLSCNLPFYINTFFKKGRTVLPLYFKVIRVMVPSLPKRRFCCLPYPLEPFLSHLRWSHWLQFIEGSVYSRVSIL